VLRIVPETLPVRQDIISKPHDIHPQPQGERVMTFTKSRVIDCIVRTYRAALACPARTGEHRRHPRSYPVDADRSPRRAMSYSPNGVRDGGHRYEEGRAMHRACRDVDVLFCRIDTR
jgi:hypothetical protein